MNDSPLIHLGYSWGIGLILLWPSGVFYSNQTGGYACLQPRIEGIFVPLHDELVDQEQMLYDYFTGPKWRGACINGIDEETASHIDHVLNLSFHTSFLRMDRERLNESHEAWVYVDVLNVAEHVDSRPVVGFSTRKGILTWSNSD